MQQSINPKYDTRNWFNVDVPLPGSYGQGNCLTSIQYLIDASIQVIVRSGPAHAIRVLCELEEDLEKVSIGITGHFFASTVRRMDLSPCRLMMSADIKQRSAFKGKVQLELTLCQPNHDLKLNGTAALIIQGLQGETLALDMNDKTQAVCLDCTVDKIDWDLKDESQADIRDLRASDIYIHGFNHSVIQVPNHDILERVECYDQARIIGAGDPQWVVDYLTGKR